MLQATDLAAIRAIITRAKRWDQFFSIIGILSLMVGMLTFYRALRRHGDPGRAAPELRVLHQLSPRAAPQTPASSRPGSVPSW
jgi:hypothetical protein